MEDPVSIDMQEVLNAARQHRNQALDNAEMQAAIITQLKKERRELQAKVKDLELELINVRREADNG